MHLLLSIQRHMLSPTSISSFFSRYLLRQRADFDELLQQFPMAVNYTHATVPDRFSCQWAKTARIFKHTSVATVYTAAISLMQDTLTFALTLEIQHSRLVKMRNGRGTLPLGYGSCWVHISELKQAIETLEQGKGLLCASFDRL